MSGLRHEMRRMQHRDGEIDGRNKGLCMHLSHTSRSASGCLHRRLAPPRLNRRDLLGCNLGGGAFAVAVGLAESPAGLRLLKPQEQLLSGVVAQVTCLNATAVVACGNAAVSAGRRREIGDARCLGILPLLQALLVCHCALGLRSGQSRSCSLGNRGALRPAQERDDGLHTPSRPLERALTLERSQQGTQEPRQQTPGKVTKCESIAAGKPYT